MEISIKKKDTILLSFAAIFVFFNLLCVGVFGDEEAKNSTVEVHVGVILNNIESWVGTKASFTSCMSIAVSDFYGLYGDYKTRLVLHTRDSNGQPLQALSAAVDLLQSVKAQALIIGSERSIETTLLAELGDQTKVPIISFSTNSPSPSPGQHPYLVKITQDGSSQVKAVARIAKTFYWTDVILIYEDNDYGRKIIPYMVKSLQKVNTRISYMSSLPQSSSEEQLIEELRKLMTMQTSVFVVNMSPSLASKFFPTVKIVGMMSEGYAWIITEKTMNLLFSMNSSVIESMEGVVGLKSYIPASKELNNFTRRWRKKQHAEDNDMDALHLSVFGIWAYDAVWALALAAERVWTKIPQARNPDVELNSTDLAKIGTSFNGSALLKEILHSRFTGLSGEIQLINGSLIPKPFEVVNLLGKGDKRIGYWSPNEGLTKEIYPIRNGTHSLSGGDLEKIIWPGITTATPKGVVVQKLKIGVPVKNSFHEMISVKHDTHTNATIVTGFCIDVFRTAIKALPYEVDYELVPFAITNASRKSSGLGPYNDLIYKVFLQEYDAVVGDTTISAERSLYVDFTLPYTDLGVGMLVKNDHKSVWIFLKPLKADLWLASAAFFILTGFVVWIIEHPINHEFQGQPSEQIGVVFSFSFSTLVFAHKEKLLSNISKFVMIVWLFIVLILTSSYTATLTSMLTVQQIQSISTGYIGYQTGSFVPGVISNLNFQDYRLKAYLSPQEYAEALSKGSNNGGVSAIIDEVPYIKVFLANYSADYSMIKPNSSTNGFGFAFRKGSPLVPEISREIQKMRQDGRLMEIENSNFNRRLSFTSKDYSDNTPNVLSFYSFRGLFLISGTSLTLALLIFTSLQLKKKWHVIRNYNYRNLFRRLVEFLRHHIRSVIFP